MSANQSSHQLSASLFCFTQYVVYFQLKWKGEWEVIFCVYVHRIQNSKTFSKIIIDLSFTTF